MPSASTDVARTHSDAARRPWVSAHLKFIASLLLLLLALFAALRLGLILRTRTGGDATWGELGRAFAVGLRFDLSTACYAMIGIAVLCYLPWTSPARGPRSRRVMNWLLTLGLSAAVLVLLAEFEFYREFQARYNQLAIRYLDQPTTVAGMAWYNYPVVPYVLVCLAGAAIIHLAVRFLLNWSYRAERASGPVRWPVEVLGGAAVVGMLVVGVRGGLQGEPLRWGDAFGGDNDYVSQMSLNGLWTLGSAMADTFDRGRQSSGWAKQLSPDEARQIARDLVVGPGETLNDPQARTVLRTGGSSTLRLSPTPSGRPYNVVVVMMESFSARYCGATGASRSFTPSFDALAKQGRLFNRCLTAGSHTHQGIFATQLGFPNLPGYETLMQSGVSNQEFCSLASIFQNRGYQTFFLYNGNFAWDNMRGFFRKQGVEKFVGGEDMLADAKYRDHVWGVSDGDLFDRCNREFEAAHQAGRPFFAAVMTLSNHAPFEVPPVPGAQPITDMGDQNKRLEAMRYADHAIGQFIEGAKKLSYFNDTLFVFVGDHGFTVRPRLTEVHLLYHHVPLLFFAPGLLPGGTVDDRVAGQQDVVPTVLALAGITDAPHAAWGRNLFDGRPAGEAFTIFKMSGGDRAVAMARGDDLLVLRDAKAEPQLYRYTLWPPAVTPADDAGAAERKKMMARQLKAYVQSAMADLTENEAGPRVLSASKH
jgi:phosphoglycerol transferase MdoB-like AlkP superfamily enzyme